MGKWKIEWLVCDIKQCWEELWSIRNFGELQSCLVHQSLKLESGEIQEEDVETHLTKGTRAEAGFGGLPALLAEETNGWLGYH